MAPVADIVYWPCREISALTGFKEDEITWLLTMFATFLASLVLSHIKSPTARKAYSSTSGLLLALYLNGPGYLFIIANFMGVYLILLTLPRQMGCKVAHMYSLSILMVGWLDYWLEGSRGVDYNTAMMPMFAKLHMYICSYSDAGHFTGKSGDEKALKDLTPREIARARYHLELPSLTTWLHFNLLVPISWSGPMVEYGSFYEFINMRKDSPISRMPNFGNWLPAWKRLAEVFILIGLNAVVSMKVDYHYLADPKFANEPLWYRCIFLQASMLIKIFQLFAAFSAMEANFIASGLSYRPKTETEPQTYNSEETRMVKCIAFLTMKRPQECTQNWNIGSHYWLKYFIMLRWMDRSKPRGKIQLGPMMLSFLMSAVWHGFYFGSYAFFSGLFLMDYTWKVAGKTQLAVSLEATDTAKLLWKPVRWFTTFLTVSYFGMPHCFCLMGPTLQMWAAFHYAGHWVLFAVIALSSVLPQVGSQSGSKVGDKVASESDGPKEAKKTN